MTEPKLAAKKRGRGRPSRIDGARIIEVARKMDPETLTMQAVADELGVDRKALHYHVADREGLMRLLAENAFLQALQLEPFVASADWRENVRSFAALMRISYISAGSLVAYVHLDGEMGLQAMVPAEQVMQGMIEAGLSRMDAAHALAFLSEFVYTSARNLLLVRSTEGEHPQGGEVRKALALAEAHEFSAMRTMTEVSWEVFDKAQFEFDLDVYILGIEAKMLRDKQ